MAVQFAGLGGAATSGSFEGQLGGQVQVGLVDRVSVMTRGGAQLGGASGIANRDGFVGAMLGLVESDQLGIALIPGISVPMGRLGADPLRITPLSSGSVDPWVSARVIGGGAWLGHFELEGRMPLYEGSDGVVQGPFGRVEARGARRVKDAVVFVGASLTGQSGAPGAPGFWGLAPVAGGVFAWGDTWAFSPSVIVPVAGGPNGRGYHGAAALAVTAVLGKSGDDDHHGEAP